MMEWTVRLICVVMGLLFLWPHATFRPRVSRIPGAALLGFLLLAAGMCAPLLLHPSEMMLASGAGTDAYIGVWNFWWMRFALEHGQNPYTCPWIFAPHGTSLALHTYSPLYALTSLPVQWLLGIRNAPGLFVAYNLVVIASFTFAGYLVYRLARLVVPSHGAAVLAGIVFAFSNYRFANTVRLHALSTEFLALSAWAFLAFLRKPSLDRLLLWIASALLLPLVALEYAAYALLLYAVLLVGHLASRPASRVSSGSEARTVPASFQRLLAWTAIGGSLALAAPFVAQLSSRLGEGSPEFDPRLSVHFSADLLDAFLPNPRHPLWGDRVAAITAGFHQGDAGYGLSLGWTAVVLALVGGVFAFRNRSERLWFAGFALFWVLSLGPTLHVGGALHERIHLPQGILSQALPFLAGSRTPIRFQALTSLFLALCVAWTWFRLESSPQLRWTGRPALAAVAILFESLSVLPMSRVELSDLYATIARAERGGALVHIPSLPARENLLYQTIHHASLLEDVSAAVPLRSSVDGDPFRAPEWGALQESLGNPGYAKRLSVGAEYSEADPGAAQALSRMRVFLSSNHVRWIVVRRRIWVVENDGGGGFREVLPGDFFDRITTSLSLLGCVPVESSADGALFAVRN